MGLSVPVVLGRLVLRLVSPAADRDAIAGDLDEELATVVLPRRGAIGASWWFLGQALRSAPPLLAVRCRRSELPPWLLPAGGATVSATGALIALDALRTFVLSQVPLRADSNLSIAYVAAATAFGLVMLACGGWAGAVLARTPRKLEASTGQEEQ